MKYPLFEPLGEHYPAALQNRHEHIIKNLIELWDTPAIDDYFTSLLVDNRGGRQGFSEDVFKDIHRLHKYRESERLTEVQQKQEALRELEMRGSNFGTEAFIKAVNDGNPGFVDLFVRAGVNVQITDKDGTPVLIIALKNGHTIIANILLTAGADPNSKDRLGFTPLLLACGKTTKGFKEIALKLIHLGAEVNVHDALGWTPLLLAISAGSAEVLDNLLDNGASRTAKTRKGETAIMLAQKFGHEKLVDLLFKERPIWQNTLL